MKKIGFVALLVIVASAFAVEAPQLPEVSKLRVLSAFKSGMAAQADAQRAHQDVQRAQEDEQRAQATLQRRFKAYQDLIEKEIEANHLPKGTTLQPDAEADTVTVMLPKQGEEKKPEPAKKPDAQPPSK